ncbi:Uu.00g133350.m01.CDS01 [Anthostomella pinea]|uniref:Uu.00g133350.m01.CDS01 n=1 Tax=Anthostomella pinea TaxID=933095 RepID=A0AAI8VME9_9PEZI|nr:Uu.00g133350.m01.CDS01 [Anthostomella pinea]
MDEPNIAVVSPSSMHVDLSPAYPWARTTLTSSDPPSSKARKRLRVAYSSSSSPTPALPSAFPRASRIAKPKRTSFKSPLAGASPKRIQHVPTAAAAVAATIDDSSVCGQQSGWHPFVPLDLPNANEEIVSPDTNLGPGNPFTLLFPFVQTYAPPLGGWHCNTFTQPDMQSLGLRSSWHHQSEPYLHAPEQLYQQDPCQHYPVDYPLDSPTDYPDIAIPFYENAAAAYFYDSVPLSPLATMVRRVLPADGTVATEEGHPAHPCSVAQAYDPDGSPQEDRCMVDRGQSFGDSSPAELDVTPPSSEFTPNGSIYPDICPTRSPPQTFDGRPWVDLCSTYPDVFSTRSPPQTIDGFWVDVTSESVADLSLDHSPPSSPEDPAVHKPEKTHRSPLEGLKREQTGQTRKWKACIRCRMQKIRCEPDPSNPETEDCLTCRKVRQESKKVIHKVPCLRWKLMELVMFRTGGLGLTRRWSGVKVKDLGPRDWVSGETKTISMSLGLCPTSFSVKVQAFHPKEGDVCTRSWVSERGEKMETYIEPFALANTKRTADEYRRYIWENAGHALRQYTERGDVDILVRMTYADACNHASRLDRRKASGFLNVYFQLWFATRHNIGTAHIDGEERLGIQPDNREGNPHRGKIMLPRMITAQFDSLGYVHMLAPLRKQVLDDLWKMMGKANGQHFFTVYLTVFMMLHEISVTSRDRYRRARENKFKEQYCLPHFVEQLQEGANILLIHWHYYKSGFNPLDMARKLPKKAIWGDMCSEELQLLMETCQAFKDRARQPLETMQYDDDLYFVSQMWEENWLPKRTFMA